MKQHKDMTKAELVAELEAGIIGRLLAVAADVQPMDKERVGDMKYKAYTIDTVYSTLRPLLAKHGVIAIPRTTSVEYVMTQRQDKSPAIDARVEIEYTFHASDGSSVAMQFASEGRDFGDKATNKAVQQAYKYGLIQMFMISTGEIDPDAVDPQIENSKQQFEPVHDVPVDVARAKQAAWKHIVDSNPSDEDVEHLKTLAADLYAVALNTVEVPMEVEPDAEQADAMIAFIESST